MKTIEQTHECFKCGKKATHVTFQKRLRFQQQLLCRQTDPKAEGHFWLTCRDCWQNASMEAKAQLVFVRIVS